MNLTSLRVLLFFNFFIIFSILFVPFFDKQVLVPTH